MSRDTTGVPIWVRLWIMFLEWADDWKPLEFLVKWFPNRYQILDDACGCERCEKRRAEGRQGPRRWGKK